MDQVECKYLDLAFSAVDAPLGINLARKKGGEFIILLSREDAKKLRDDLSDKLGD